MTILTSPLYRKLLYLFRRHEHLGMNNVKSCIVTPCPRLLRLHCYCKSGLVTAADLVSYWQNVFEVNEVPEALASSEYIVSHILGAKTVKYYNV